MTQLKKAEFVKLDQGMLEDMPAPNLKDIFKSDLSYRGSTYDRGTLMRPFDPKNLKMGYDSDDFARNLVTIVCDQYGYRKVPRILWAVYREKKYEPRHQHRSLRKKLTVIYKSPRIIKDITITEVSLLPGGGHGIGFTVNK